MFQNMVGTGNTSDQHSQHKLDTLKNTIINEGIEIIGLAKVYSNWSKIPIKGIYIIGQTDGLKQGGPEQGINELPFTTEHLKVEALIS